MNKRLSLTLLTILMFAFSLLASGALASPSVAVEQGQRTPVPTLPESAEEIDTEDWPRIEGDGVALLLPEGFQGGDLEALRDMADDMVSMLGDDFAAVESVLAASPEIFRFFAFDPELVVDGVLTNVNIVASPIPSGFDMEFILEATQEQFPDTFEIVESEVIELGDFEDVGWMLIETEVMDLEQRIAQYYFVIDEMLYAITYTAAPDVYEELQAVFEASAATFELIEEE